MCIFVSARIYPAEDEPKPLIDIVGEDPATEKQLAYLKVLEKKHSALSEGDAQLGKSEASVSQRFSFFHSSLSITC